MCFIGMPILTMYYRSIVFTLNLEQTGLGHLKINNNTCMYIYKIKVQGSLLFVTYTIIQGIIEQIMFFILTI